jgi:hypothetical protein
MVGRIPTLLSDEEIVSWKRWIDIIASTDMSHLNIAMTRTLQAMSARRDVHDRLIDAVIAWEALFGAEVKIKHRISSSLALMLHGPENRDAARERYRRIYQARSDIVHANRTVTTLSEIDEYGRNAIESSLKIIAKILTTHRELLPLTSSVRSTRIMSASAGK